MKNNSKFKEFFRVIKYGLIAASAGLIELGVEALMVEVFGIRDNFYWISYTVALILSVIWNFTINRRYTFKSAGNVKKAMIKVALYYVVFTPLSLLFGQWLVNKGLNENIVTIINMLINFITEFLYQRFFVFKDSIDSNDLA